MATVFTNAPIVVIAYTLIVFFMYPFFFILLPFIQLYSTAVNAAFNAAAILLSLLAMLFSSCLSITMYHNLPPQIKGSIKKEQVLLANNPFVSPYFQQTIAKWFVITYAFRCWSCIIHSVVCF